MADMNLKLKSFQRDFLIAPARYPAMVSGWATGKTLMGILRGLLYTEYIPNNLGVIFRKEYTDLRDSTVMDFERYTGLKVNSQRNVDFGNKSVIMFRHLEELNNLQNINLGWFLIEQIDELETDHEFFMLQGRLRRDVEPEVKFMELNMPFRTGFVIGNVGREWVKNLWKDSPRPEYSLSEATTFDNQDVLPGDFIQSMKDLEHTKPEIYGRYVMNDWTVSEDSFIIIPLQCIRELKGISYTDTLIGDVIACDPSAGGDECAIYVMKNHRIIDSKFMYEKDTMKIAGHLIILSHRYQILDFAIDSIGIGKGVCDRLGEMNKRVMEINSASSPDFGEGNLYYNKKAQMWAYTGQKIIDKQIPYPNDEELIKQLSNVKYKVVNSNGQIKVEAKDETKKRLGRSPDRADAYVMGIWATQFMNPRNELFKPYKYRKEPAGVIV